jgi:hypothetical protein
MSDGPSHGHFKGLKGAKRLNMMDWMEGVLTLNGSVTRADSGHELMIVSLFFARARREGKIIVWIRRRDKKARQGKARQARFRSDQENAEYSRSDSKQEGEMGSCSGMSGVQSLGLLSCQDERKNNCEWRQPKTIRSVARLYSLHWAKVSPSPEGSRNSEDMILQNRALGLCPIRIVERHVTNLATSRIHFIDKYVQITCQPLAACYCLCFF